MSKGRIRLFVEGFLGAFIIAFSILYLLAIVGGSIHLLKTGHPVMAVVYLVLTSCTGVGIFNVAEEERFKDK
jgi:hypothetical protein